MGLSARSRRTTSPLQAPVKESATCREKEASLVPHQATFASLVEHGEVNRWGDAGESATIIGWVHWMQWQAGLLAGPP